MPLHIVIDARRVRDFGIGTYIRNITRSLSLLDAENQYTLVAHPNDAAELAGLGSNFRIAPFSIGDRGLKHNLSFPGFLRSLKASLYHIPLNSVAWAMPRPYVVTIHDMSSLLFPAAPRFPLQPASSALPARAVARAARVIAVSQCHPPRSGSRSCTFRGTPFAPSTALPTPRSPACATIPRSSARFWTAIPSAIPTFFTPEPFACTKMSRAWWKLLRCCARSWKITRCIRICGW